MKLRYKWIFTLLIALSVQFSFAQEKTVTGTVSDASGTLPGANVVVQGTKTGTQTDANGKYTLKVKVGDVLVFSFVGMTDSTAKVGAANVYNAKLQEGTVLKDVVVEGYGKTRVKSKSNISSVTVSSESLENRPNLTFTQSLQGLSSGLSVATSSGQPGSAKIDLLIRGLGTINGSSEPLYVIDGIPTNSVVFRNINSEDISSVSILKDAAATSIYGSRGANGVLVITTKTGKFNSPLKLTYSTTSSTSYYPTSKYNMNNAQQALYLERDSGYGAGNGDSDIVPSIGGGAMTDAEIDGYATTDWNNYFYRTGNSTNHNIGMSIGGDRLANFTSLSYTKQEGIVPTTDFKRFTLRTNFNGKSKNDKFTYSTNTTIAYSRRHQLNEETSTTIGNNVIQNALLGVLTAMPYVSSSIYNGSGSDLYGLIATNFSLGHSALVLQDVVREGSMPTQVDDIKLLTSLQGTYNLTDNLKLNSKIGVDFTNSERMFARTPGAYLAIAVQNSNSVPFGGLEFRRYDRDYGFNSITNLNYHKEIGSKHTIDGGLYFEYINSERRLSTMQQNGLIPNNYVFGTGAGWSNVGGTYASLRPTVGGLKARAGNISYFGTFGYDYDSKYGIELLVRRDASYRFTDNYKWGTFWSVDGRWNIDKEEFMSNSVFNMLKLRASYGIQGNQNIIDVAADENPIYAGNNVIRDIVSTGNGYNGANGFYYGQFANVDARWEKQAMTNLGLDFEINNNKISGSIDVYEKRTTDLYTYIGSSASTGFFGYNGNGGTLSNKGIELMLKYNILNNQSKAFKLSIFANGAYNKNEIIDIERQILGNNRILENGSLVNEFYLVPYVGVNPGTGNAWFLDINGNKTETIDATDRRRTGKSTVPIYQGGFGLNADYKGFSLDVNFSYAAEFWRVDNAWNWIHDPNAIGDYNVSSDMLNAWTPTNTDTDVASLNATNLTSATNFSDRNLFDSSYIRLKTITLGYNVNKKFLTKTSIKALKIFATGENILTWTKWKGYDPENTTTTFTTGIFPNPKVASFGLSIEF